MTTKTIRFSNGVSKEMTFEEVEKQFNRMLNRFAENTINRIVYNKPEKDDLMQELRYELWEAFDRYDSDLAVFSTFATYRLKLAVNKVVNPMMAKKRTNVYGEVSMNSLMKSDEDEAEYGDLIGELDESYEDIEFAAFITKLSQQLTEPEQIMLKSLINKKEFSVAKLGEELGITRMGAHLKLKQFKEKMAHILISTGYAVV